MSCILRESVDLKKVNYLVETYTFNLFKESYTGTATDCKKDFNKLTKYLNSKLNGNEEVRYNYSMNRKDGRLYGTDSIQNVFKNVRGFICEGIATDLDIQNCHPFVLNNLCKEHDIECPYLFQYVSDRENVLEKIMSADNITRGEAKQKVLVATNSNKNIRSESDFLKGYNKEIKIIQAKFLLIDKYKYLIPFAKQHGNFIGSFLNHVMCVSENEILQLIKKCCEESEMTIHSLMFDGLMVYGDITEGFIKIVEEYVERNSNFKGVKLSIKSHETTFKIPDDYKCVVRQSYEQVFEEFNKTNCKVGVQFVNYTNEINVYSRSEFAILHEEVVYYSAEKYKNVPFIDAWFLDATKDKYDCLDSYPKDNLCPDNVFNLWEKYPMQLIEKSIDEDKCREALEFFVNHIKVLCNYEDDVIQFVLMWIAQMFQYPENKTMELVFISSEGAGKGLFLEFLKTIMGSKRVWECTDPQRDIYGSFNDMMRDAVLVCLNEANKAGIYNQNDKKKALITDNVININIKGGKRFTMRSYHRFLTFTNNSCPTVPNKRRDCIIRCSDDKIDDVEYFNKGFAYANNIGCCKYIYDFFMEYETKPKLTSSDIPLTEHHKTMVEEHKNPMRGFFIRQTLRWFEQGKTRFKTTPDKLFDVYCEYCHDEDVEPKKKRSFATAMSFEKLDLKSEKTWDVDLKKSVRKYEINVDELMTKLGLTADMID